MKIQPTHVVAVGEDARAHVMVDDIVSNLHIVTLQHPNTVVETHINGAGFDVASVSGTHVLQRQRVPNKKGGDLEETVKCGKRCQIGDCAMSLTSDRRNHGSSSVRYS